VEDSPPKIENDPQILYKEVKRMSDNCKVPHTGAAEVKAPKPVQQGTQKASQVVTGKDLRTGK
jgi:hypothetical protein